MTIEYTTKAQSPCVLVVDDFAPVRHLLAAQLKDAGFGAVEAENGFEALERLSSEPIDLVVTDIRMPGLNGFDLVRAVRELAPSTPVVVITGAGALAEATEQCPDAPPIELVVDAVCLKPFRVGEVLDTIRELLVTGRRLALAS